VGLWHSINDRSSTDYCDVKSKFTYRDSKNKGKSRNAMGDAKLKGGVTEVRMPD
jgi:hypothetical protein